MTTDGKINFLYLLAYVLEMYKGEEWEQLQDQTQWCQIWKDIKLAGTSVILRACAIETIHLTL